MTSAADLAPLNPDYAETTRRFLLAMPIVQDLAFAITDVGPGRFEITQPYRRELSFRDGIFQAGPIGTIADMAAVCAAATMLPAGWSCSTVDFTLKLLAAATGDRLIAGCFATAGRCPLVPLTSSSAVASGRRSARRRSARRAILPWLPPRKHLATPGRSSDQESREPGISIRSAARQS